VYTYIFYKSGITYNSSYLNLSSISKAVDVKGSDQRKLRWVKIGVFQWVWASYRGAGYYFVILGGHHLVYTIFPLPVSTAQIKGEFGRNR
jgi:hypothetical protein